MLLKIRFIGTLKIDLWISVNRIMDITKFILNIGYYFMKVINKKKKKEQLPFFYVEELAMNASQ